DAHWLVVFDGNFDHRAEVVVVFLANRDIPRIDAIFGQRLHACGILLQQDMAVVVEVADDRHRKAKAVEAVHNVGHGGSGGVVVNRDAHQFGTGTSQGCTLADGAVNIGGVGVGHGLHHDWCIAANPHSGH